MKILSSISCLLILITRSQQIDIYVDGTFTDSARFCVGDNVTFTCTILAPEHQWSVDNPHLDGLNGYVTLSNDTAIQRGPFTITTENGDFGRTSSLHIVLFEGFPNAVGCLGFGSASGTQAQSIPVNVLEQPTAPSIYAEAVDNYQTFNLSIGPPEKGVFCVLQYNISLSDNAGNSFVGTVNVSNPQLSIRVDVKDIIGNVTLDMCRYRYTFQVAAVNGKEITPPTSPAIDFSEFGDLSEVTTTEFTVQWNVPRNLDGCITKYFYTLGLTNQSNFLNSSSNRMSLTDFGPPMGDCNVDDLTVVPVIPAMDEPLFNSSTTDRLFLRTPFSTPPMVVDNSIDSITVVFRISINNCPEGMVEASIVPVSRESPLRHERLPLSATEVTFTRLNETVSEFFCSFAVFTPVLGVFHTEKLLCEKNTTTFDASVIESFKNTSNLLGIGLGSAVAVLVLSIISGVALSFILTKLKVLQRLMRAVKARRRRSPNSIHNTLASLRSVPQRLSRRK